MKNRNKLLKHAEKKQINLGLWFNSLIYPCSEKDLYKFGYIKGTCPNAEMVARNMINLPNHQEMEKQDIERVLKALK